MTTTPQTESIGVPSTVAGITAAWLTAALRSSGTIADDAQLVDVQCSRVGEGSGIASVLYRVSYREVGRGAATLIAKLPAADPDTRAAGEFAGVYPREIAFYEGVARLSPIPTPRMYFSAQARESTDFILLIEDIGHLELADHLAGLPIERAGVVIDAIAAHHAWSVQPDNADRVGQFATLADDPVIGLLNSLVPMGWAAYKQLARTPPTAVIDELMADFATHVPSILSALSEPAALAHGDLRVDNLFFDGDGQPWFVDFQCCIRATGVYDIAYLCSQGLRTDERRGRDQELVRRYCSAAERAGLDGVDFDTAWRQYQLASILQIVLPVGALTQWEHSSDRARELFLVLIERATATIEDIDARSALR